MKTRYALREDEYSRLKLQPRCHLAGFALYKGSPESQHAILGEDHSQPAALAVYFALDKLVEAGKKTLVIGETPYHGRDYTIKNVSDAFASRERLVGWPDKTINLLLERGAHLVMHDSSRLLRLSTEVRKDDEEFMRISAHRDAKQASLFSDKTKEYERVIGIYGSLHVLSPVLDRMLEKINLARYVFVGFRDPSDAE